MDSENFKVIIVGGSISGLSLAHCLDRAGVEYVVLERYKDIAPQVGASVGIMPNGARILDQLGLFDAVELEIEPLDRSHIWYPGGFGFSSVFPKVLRERFGYPVSFLDRQKLLAILYNSLKDRSKVRINKEVTRIDHDRVGSRVSVLTTDGCRYHGDLVVGTDGVHSKIRSCMWQEAEQKQPGLISCKEKSAMTVDYLCVFGISAAVPGLKIGEQITCFYDEFTILTFHGRNGRIFWFIIKKTDKRYSWPDIPRFTKADAERLCLQLQHMRVHKRVDFGQIWANHESYSMTALEECVFDHWHFGRVVCFGDSMHKTTPNLGQGANSGIESAAALANSLHDLLRRSNKPRDVDIDAALEAFNILRRKRTKKILKQAAFVTRLQARDGLFNILIGRYVVPYLGDVPASMAGKVMVGAEKLSFVPLPRRSEKGWSQDTNKQALSERQERRFRRVWQALQAFGLLVLVVGSVKMLNNSEIQLLFSPFHVNVI